MTATVDMAKRTRKNWRVIRPDGKQCSKLKAGWYRLAGGEPARPTGRQPGCRIQGLPHRPAPYRAGDQYQTAGTIEKDTPEGVKEHRFIRADTYHSKDDAIAFTISKAKQIIDQQGDRIFT
jgi:hypothetical protein